MNSSSKKEKNKKFSLKARLKSFRHAFAGIGALLKFEHNARIHLFILIIVILAGVLLGISASEWIAILVVAGLVFVSECFNTSIEYISDLVTGEENENIKRAKDIAAAGVFIAAIIAVITGLIIFVPEICGLFSR